MELTKEDVEKFEQLENKIQDFGKEIFEYIYKNGNCLLDFENFSDYDESKIFFSRSFDIKYCDKYYNDYNWINIPLKEIYNNTWKEFIDDLIKQKREEELKEKQEIDANTEREELELLKRLKEKYRDYE